jgi:hypothetical protein
MNRQSSHFNVIRDAGTLDYENVQLTMLMLERIVIEQLNTVDDALEDWRDLVPDEVKAIEEQVQKKERDRDGES